MATIQFKKGDEYLMRLSKLEAMATREVCGAAIYAGADIVADAIREQLEKIPTDDRFVSDGELKRGPSKAQKEGLARSLGIASMQDDGTGYLDVKIGFDGYNTLKTQRWPKGQPNQMVARAVERGTSFMAANAFVKTACARSRKSALATMGETVDQKIEKIMTGGSDGASGQG